MSRWTSSRDEHLAPPRVHLLVNSTGRSKGVTNAARAQTSIEATFNREVACEADRSAVTVARFQFTNCDKLTVLVDSTVQVEEYSDVEG